MFFCNDRMFVSHLVTSAPFSISDHDSLIFSLLIDSRIDTNSTNKSNVWSYDFSTLIFSLFTIIYLKLIGSVNLHYVRPLLLYGTHSMVILIKLLLISFQLNIASPSKVITSLVNLKDILDL